VIKKITKVKTLITRLLLSSKRKKPKMKNLNNKRAPSLNNLREGALLSILFTYNLSKERSQLKFSLTSFSLFPQCNLQLQWRFKMKYRILIQVENPSSRFCPSIIPSPPMIPCKVIKRQD
jgi:hypothetical protein